MSAAWKTVTIVIAGAGKSTLLNNLFEFDDENILAYGLGSKSVTTEIVERIYNKNNITIRVIDTPCFKAEQKDVKQQLIQFSRYTKSKPDILVYCLPVDSSHKFETDNPRNMKILQQAFGKDIWQHCLLVFTWNNDAIRTCKEKGSDYQELIDGYGIQFQQELGKLGVKNVKVTNVLDGTSLEKILEDIPDTTPPDIPNEDMPPYEERPAIIAIPAIIADVLLVKRDWRENIIFLIATCNPDSTQAILQYKYGQETARRLSRVKDVTAGGIVGEIMVRAVTGACVGGVVGVSAGSVGMVAGVAVGTAMGITVGRITGAVEFFLKTMKRKREAAQRVQEMKGEDTETRE